MAPFPLPSWRWKEQIVPAVSSFTPSVPSTEVILTEPGHVRPPLPGLVTLAVAFRDTAAGSPSLPTPWLRVRCFGSGRVPRESLDAPKDLPKEPLRQAAAIARIHDEGIEERIATFETEPRTTGQIEAQLTERPNRYPSIVVERVSEVIAFAGAGPYQGRSACAGVTEYTEHSVYTAPEARGAGAGRAAWTP